MKNLDLREVIVMEIKNKSGRVIGTRFEEIGLQIGVNRIIRGELVPPVAEVEIQAGMIDLKLNSEIQPIHIELLYDISRAMSWYPSITELERAYKYDKFKKEFPPKRYESKNLLEMAPLTEEQKQTNYDFRQGAAAFYKSIRRI